MGLLKRNRAKKEKENNSGSLQFMTVEEALRKNSEKSGKTGKDNLISLVHEDCSQLLAISREDAENKAEYEAVTNYLSDIQLIERADDAERQKLFDCASHILTLEKERRKQSTIENRLPDRIYHRLERYEAVLPGDIQKLEEQEEYHDLVESDMRKLDGERESIKAMAEDAGARIVFLKRLNAVGLILVLFIFCVLFGIGEYAKLDMMIPFLLTGLLAVVLVLFVVTGVKSSRVRKRELEQKMNRAIALTNKIKLKYVTSTAALDYTYGKYGVESAPELKRLWERFVKEKDEEKRLLQNSELLEFYKKELVRNLKELGLYDSEVWVRQTEALTDKKEMVEVRHRLNDRRQKIRNRIDLSVTERDMINNRLNALAEQNPENARVIRNIMAEYGLTA